MPGLQLVTPRKARSTWTRLNRQRMADMEVAGLMAEAGRRSVEVAQENGWWTIYDSAEDLVEPLRLRRFRSGDILPRMVVDPAALRSASCRL